MAKPDEFPGGHPDERELLLTWLAYLRTAVLRDLDGLSEDQARWRPEGRLISVLGVVNHLTHVEWRWIDGGMRGLAVSREEGEFAPDASLTVLLATDAYLERGRETDAWVRSASSLTLPCSRHHEGRSADLDLRWVLIHLINETARHAGHADATRELIDGRTGE